MYYVGIDVAQVNNGLSIIDENSKVIFSEDFGHVIPDELTGKDTPDLLKNNFQILKLREILLPYKDKIAMILLEGPNYSSSSNVTPISIGSIHGSIWQFCFDLCCNFAILTPKSIQLAIHGTAKDITKTMTKDKMKELYPDFKNFKHINSNMADSLAMATLAKKFADFIFTGAYLSKSEQEVFISKQKYKGLPKGLVWQLNKKYFVFDRGVLVSSFDEVKKLGGLYGKEGK